MAVTPKKSKAAIEAEQQLVNDIAAFQHDPLGYCLYAFPWGKKGTELEKHVNGPRKWQREVLESIGAKLLAQADANVFDVIQEACASGHGIGKSALFSMLTMWAMSTFEDTRGVITANTDTQLRTKTWPEVSKWHRLAINSHWFKLEATSMHSIAPGHEKNWKVDIIPWSEHNTEAFQGLHNEGKRLFIFFDEASGIADKIHEVTEGALTDEGTEIIWLQFGNPTKTTGRFRECFNRFKHRWTTRNIDSRTVEGTNKAYLERIVQDNGEDSDVARIRVRGMFPRASAMQLIETDVVAEAMKRVPIAGLRDPLIMTVDIARGGADEFSIGYRRGMDAKSLPSINIPGSEARDSMKMVAKVVDLATTDDRTRRPDAIIVDETGVGGPIVDRLRQILGDGAQVYGVNFASASPDPKLANMRAFMWWKGRDWLRGGGCIEDDPQLEAQLTGPEYTHDKGNRVLLEPKDDLRDRLGVSPDRADRLMLSFAYNIQPREATHALQGTQTQGKALTDYDPFSR